MAENNRNGVMTAQPGKEPRLSALRRWRIRHARTQLADALWYHHKWIAGWNVRPSKKRDAERDIAKYRAKVERLERRYGI